ncbi:MAG: hypothetical protein KF724_02170 [Phycisphaeraceae bacterium]|nr:hypothetical protein [Phycisphaeraceae bacterium]
MTKKRTVFRVTWSTTFQGPVDADSTLRFPADTGTADHMCAFNWAGDDGATRIAAKMEATATFSPSGIDWPARGVLFVYSMHGGGAKFRCRLHRYKRWQVVAQVINTPNRIIPVQGGQPLNDADWVYDGHSDPGDAQYPTAAKPDKAFRIDAPGFPPSAFAQAAMRADFVEVLEWHNGSAWIRCSSSAYADWYTNITAILPNAAQGTPNNHGRGTAANVPNVSPVANAGPNQAVGGSILVTLNGLASSDVDNDVLTYLWNQTGGPAVTLSNNTLAQPTFTSPPGPATLTFELRVSDITKALHHHTPGNYESLPDDVEIQVNP